MQSKTVCTNIEKILLKLTSFAIQIDNEKLADSKLENTEQISKRIEDIKNELLVIEQKNNQIKENAEKYDNYLKETEKLRNQIKGTGMDAITINEKITNQENKVWNKIREDQQEKADLKVRKRALFERSALLNEKLENMKQQP